MIVERWHIEGFGHFSNSEERLGPGLTVIQGPNEAGKSTLLEFVTFVLFGFRPHYRGNRYPPLHGGRHGGRLWLRTRDGSWVVERYAAKGLEVRLPDQTPGSERDLQQVLGVADRELYRSVFAFDLADLQELQKLTSEGVQERLFSAGVSGAGRAVSEVKKELEMLCKELWKKRGQCKIRERLDELSEARSRLDAVKAAAGELPALRCALREAEERRGTLASLEWSEQRRAERYRLLEAGWQEWPRRTALRQELAELPEVPPTRRSELDEVQELERRAQESERTAAELDEELEGRRSRLGDIELLPDIEAVAAEAQKLSEDRRRCREWLTRCGELERQVEECQRERERRLERLGCGWTVERCLQIEVTAELVNRGREWSRTLPGTEAELDSDQASADDGLKSSEEALKQLEKELAAVPLDPAVDALQPRVRSLRSKLSAYEQDLWDLKAAEGRVDAEQEQVDRKLRLLGPEWNVERVSTLDTSHVVEQKLRTQGRLLREARDAETRAKERREELRAAPESHREVEPLSTVARHEEALARLRAARTDAEHLGRSVSATGAAGEERPKRPLVLIVALTLALAASAALLVDVLAAVPLLILGAAASAVLWRMSRPRDGQVPVQGSWRPSPEILEAAQALGLSPQPSSDQLEAKWIELQNRRRRAEQAEQRRSKIAELESEVTAAASAHEVRRGEWSALLKSCRLPESLDVETATSFLGNARDLQQIAADLAKHQQERQSRQSAVAQFEREARALATDLRMEVDAACSDPARFLDVLEDRVAGAKEARRRSEDLQEQVARARSRLDQAHQRDLALAPRHEELKRLREGWERWKVRVGLPGDLVPEDTPSFVEHLEAVGEAQRQLASREQELSSVEESIARFVMGADEVSRLLDRAAVEQPETALSVIVDLSVEVEQARDRRQKWTHLQDEILDLEKRREHRLGDLKERQAALLARLNELAVPSVAALADRLETVEKRRDLAREIDQLEARLRALCGNRMDEADFRQELASGNLLHWREEAKTAEAKVADLKHQQEEAIRAHESLLNRVATLETSAEVVKRSQQVNDLEAELAQLRRQLLRYQMASSLLDGALTRFRRERQPGVLRDAADLFETVTDGQYVGLMVDDAKREITVEDLRGGAHPSALLSTGTKEQLYLCMRLGLASEYAQRTRFLPVVMDDVLVNFDPARGAATARTIWDFAREGDDRQVLIFTCRPETVDAFRNVAIEHQAELPVLQLERFAGHGAPTATASRMPLGGSDEETDDEHEIAVIRCLESADEPLGKNEIVERTGMPEGAWSRTITALKSREAVIQHGDRRGARYELSID